MSIEDSHQGALVCKADVEAWREPGNFQDDGAKRVGVCFASNTDLELWTDGVEQGVIDNMIVFQKPFPGAARTDDLRARFAARSTRVLVLGAQEHPQGSLHLAYTPPQPGQVPHIARVQKLSAVQSRLLVLGVYPPPAGAGPRYYPYAKVISNARSDLQKVLLRGVYPPPAGAGPRYYPYAKVINSAQTDPHMEKVYGLG